MGTRWIKSGKTSGPESNYKVTDVDEGTEVQFQVRAENEAGVGEPSEPTDIIKIEDPISMSQQIFARVIWHKLDFCYKCMINTLII